MSDGISQMHRDMREEQERAERREKYLAAALSYLGHDVDASLTEVVRTYDAICATKRGGGDYGADGGWRPYHYDQQTVAFETRAKFGALALDDRDEWLMFLLKDVGIEDAATRTKFMEVSPFRGCLVILTKNVKNGTGYELSGDTDGFISLISAKGSATVESVYEKLVPSHDPSLRGARFRVYRVTPKK